MLLCLRIFWIQQRFSTVHIITFFIFSINLSHKQVSTCYDMIRSRISCVTHFEKIRIFLILIVQCSTLRFFLTVINHSQYVLLPAEYSPQVSTIIVFVSAVLLPNMKRNNMLCSMCTFLGSSFYCFSKNSHKYWTPGTHNWYYTVYSVSYFRKTKPCEVLDTSGTHEK